MGEKKNNTVTFVSDEITEEPPSNGGGSRQPKDQGAGPAEGKWKGKGIAEFGERKQTKREKKKTEKIKEGPVSEDRLPLHKGKKD